MGRRRFVECGGPAALLRTLNTSSTTEAVAAACCRTLCALSQEMKGREALLSLDAVSAVFAVLENWKSAFVSAVRGNQRSCILVWCMCK